MKKIENHGKSAARRFLKSVAIIDDEATYDYEESEPLDQGNTTNLIAPTGIFDDVIPVDDETVENITPEESSTHILDAGTVVNSFADLGIVCCVQRPTREDNCVDRAATLAQSADVLIIDWDLRKTNKRLARDILQRVIESDHLIGGRERLLIVYTAQKNADSILKDLTDDVRNLKESRVNVEKSEFAISCDQLRVVVLNKEKTKAPASGARIVSFSELPNEVVSEFHKLVNGVVATATLNTISALRERTHQLLGILNHRLDGAFCHHRALLDEPSDSIDFALGLITSEIQTVLVSDDQARRCLEKEGIKIWFDKYFKESEKISINGEYSLSPQTAWKLLANGGLGMKQKGLYQRALAIAWLDEKIKKGTKLKNVLGDDLDEVAARELIEKNKFHSVKSCQPSGEMSFVEGFYDSKAMANTGCLELSGLQCTARDEYSRIHLHVDQTPTLQLGTVISLQNKRKTKFYLCLQPLCDSVRIEETTAFLFLEIFESKGKKFDIVIQSDANHFLKLSLKRPGGKFQFETCSFNSPDGRDRIFANRWNKQFRFRGADERSFRWRGELRREKSQIIAQSVAANSSRIGIDEFEWSRRLADFSG